MPRPVGAPKTRQVADRLLVFVGLQSPTTLMVSKEFGWTTVRARRELDALRDEGLVIGSWEQQRSGAMNRWRLS